MPRGRPHRSNLAVASWDRARTRGQTAITAHMATQTKASVPPTATAEDLVAAMQTIATGQSALMGKIDHLQTNVDFIHRDLDTFRGRGGAAALYGRGLHHHPLLHHTMPASEPYVPYESILCGRCCLYP